MAARLMPTDRAAHRARAGGAGEHRPLAGRLAARSPASRCWRETETVRLLVLPDRRALGAGIDARFDAMLAAGALEEVRALLALGLSEELPIMRALGVAPLAAISRARSSLEAAVAAAKAETRQYAKRQLTWLKTQYDCVEEPVNTQETERIDLI